jgi:hypothetical protein
MDCSARWWYKYGLCSKARQTSGPTSNTAILFSGPPQMCATAVSSSPARPCQVLSWRVAGVSHSRAWSAIPLGQKRWRGAGQFYGAHRHRRTGRRQGRGMDREGQRCAIRRATPRSSSLSDAPLAPTCQVTLWRPAGVSHSDACGAPAARSPESDKSVRSSFNPLKTLKTVRKTKGLWTAKTGSTEGLIATTCGPGSRGR